MEWEQLQYFRVAGRLQHITRAADKLGIAQPTLSRAIARLERELGVPLFVHAGRSVKLTRYGTIFLERVERALFEIDEARRTLADLTEGGGGSVHVGFLRTLGNDYVPELVKRFRIANPQVTLAFTQSNGAELLRLMRAGDIDTALVSGPLAGEDIVWRKLFDQELTLIVPLGHRFADRRTVRVAELAGEPFVAFKSGHAIRAISDDVFAHVGIAPSIAFAGDESSVLRGFVAAGFGVGMVPASASTNDDVRTIRLTAPAVTRAIGIAWVHGRYRSGAERAFERFVLTSGSIRRREAQASA